MESLFHWLNDHLLRCPVQALLGIDCPGCGFQRALLALLQGDLQGCWEMYPPMLPFLATMALVLLAGRTKLRYRMPLLAASVAITCIFIAVNYGFKIF